MYEGIKKNLEFKFLKKIILLSNVFFVKKNCCLLEKNSFDHKGNFISI